MKRLLTIIASVLVAFGLSSVTAHAANGDMTEQLANGDITVTVSAIQDKFSEFLTPQTGVIPWEQFVDIDSEQLRTITPLAIIEGQALMVVRYMGSPDYSGNFTIVGLDQGACVIGALVAGFTATYEVPVTPADKELLSALAYTQLDSPHPVEVPSMSRLGAAMAHIASMDMPPTGVSSFLIGLQHGPLECGFPAQDTAST